MSLNLIMFVMIVTLGIVGNLKAYKNEAFKGWQPWFANIFWVLALKFTWAPILT
jgi:hypothetical protein